MAALGFHCCVGLLSSWWQGVGFSLQWFLLLQNTGSRCTGFSSCSSGAQDHRLTVVTHTGLVALWHVGSSWIRDRTCVSCIGRQILIHHHQGSPRRFTYIYMQMLVVESLMESGKKKKLRKEIDQNLSFSPIPARAANVNNST